MTTSDFDSDVVGDTATGGFLSDLGLDSVETDPNHLPDATYKGYLTDCKVVQFKDASKGQALVFTYKVSEGPHKGKTIDEWKTANKFDPANKKAWLKSRILSLGVPESRLNILNPDDLIGTPVSFTVKKKGEYTNVTFVKERNEDENSDDSTDSIALDL